MAVARFGRYKVTAKLGSGAMGEVYAAVDEVLGREVAIKTLRGQASGLGARIVDERFRLEARAIASLTHPGIVQVFDVDLAAEPPFLVMERVIGPSLKERMAQGPMPADEVRALGIQIARALAASHAAGIVHRDVKPANILIAGPRSWKLVDFGVAHVPDSSLTMTGQFIGSPAYAPPEALLGGKSTPAGDVFGLGASLYIAASGRWPRDDAPTSAPLAPIPSVRQLVATLDADLAAAIDRAVSIEYEHRPTATELAELLDAKTPPSVETVFVPDESSPPRRRRWGVWLALALAATGSVAVVGAMFINNDQAKPSSAPQPPLPAEVSAAAVTPPTHDDAVVPDDALEGDANVDARLPIKDPPPGQLRIITPPMPADPQAMKDWRRVADKLYDRKLDDARTKLIEWEQKWGATAETGSLHRQLDAMPRSN
jgi:eukaryotic-like serine/threonine-protein kinase